MHEHKTCAVRGYKTFWQILSDIPTSISEMEMYSKH